MKKIDKNSKTRENLLKAFLGESGARNKYTYYAKVAEKEGFQQISGFFIETAENEKEHAKIFLKYLGENFDEIEIKNEFYSIGLNETTEKNLEFSINGERKENTILYPNFASIAKDEGYEEIYEGFIEIIEVEKIHEKRFMNLLENIKSDMVFKKQKEVIWKCRNCGYHAKDFIAPCICPSCKHKQEYFEVFIKNY